MLHLMKSADIVALSEHKLYPHELHHLSALSDDFISWGKSSADLDMCNYGRVPGHGGVALLWHKSLSGYVKPLKNLGSDRICVIRVHPPGPRCMNVIAVYLPQSDCRIADYQTQLDILESTVTECMQSGQVVIIGDWNAHYGEEWGPRGVGRTTTNGHKTKPFLERCSLHIADMAHNSSGPTYTYCGENGGMSYIDHCVISPGLKPLIRSCSVVADVALNTSDHLPVRITMEKPQISATSPRKPETAHVIWHRLNQKRSDSCTQNHWRKLLEPTWTAGKNQTRVHPCGQQNK